MQWTKLPINQAVYTSIDEVSLTGNLTPNRLDTYQNDAGAVSRRPGYNLLGTTGITAPIDGMYDWTAVERILIVSGGNIYYKTKESDVILLGSSFLMAGNRPTFADFGETVYIANGNKIVKVNLGGCTTLTDPDIPSNVSHVVAFDGYLIANEGGTDRFHWSNVLTPDIWEFNFATAEQSPDNITAIYAKWSELWLFGEKSVEKWYNDGVTPFAPNQSSTMSIGCLAPGTIQYINDNFYWLNEKREIVKTQGSQYEVVSLPISNILQEISDVSNVVADFYTVGGNYWYVLNIPGYNTHGITLVYDIKRGEWQGQWGYWDQLNENYERFRGLCYLYVPDWNQHIIGDKSNGYIYDINTDTYTDNGAIIKSTWLTNYIDYDTAVKKRSHKLRFKLKRGVGALGTSPKLMLRWRNDGNKEWGNFHYIDLGAAGDTDHYVTINRLGMYVSRQYELSITDNVPVVVAGAEELLDAGREGI